MSGKFETSKYIENPFAEDKASLVGEIIKNLAPKNPEMEKEWGEFSRNTNPNENKQLFKFTTEHLLEHELIEKYGTDTTEALDIVVAGSPKYNFYRNAAMVTYDFIGNLFNQGVANTENVRGFVASFGSESFPSNQEQLASMLGLSVQELPNSSQEMFLSMKHVDTTLKMSSSFGKDSTADAMPQMGATNEWLSDDIDEETKKWLNSSGHENIASEYSQTEQERAREYSEHIHEQATYEANKNLGTFEVLKEVFDGEGSAAEEAQDASKLLLRIAVKAGVALAVSIARNISKDKDIPQEIRIMMGVFADGLSRAEDFVDRVIAGDTKADLQRDIIAFIKDRYN